MSSRDDLLNNLVADLEPVAPAPDTRVAACLWLLASAAWVVLLTHLVGPIRPNALDQLQAHPRFLAEMVAGLLTVVGLGLMAFRAAIPGAVRTWMTWPLMLVGGLWLAAIAAGLVAPALEPSMLGKRDHCYLEGLMYALPPLVAAMFWQSRQYPLRAAGSAVLAGLAAGALPALYMQIACMYQPMHILLFHIGPGIALGLLAPLLLLGFRRLRLSRG